MRDESDATFTLCPPMVPVRCNPFQYLSRRGEQSPLPDPSNYRMRLPFDFTLVCHPYKVPYTTGRVLVRRHRRNIWLVHNGFTRFG
jgi:hypothetical protein